MRGYRANSGRVARSRTLLNGLGRADRRCGHAASWMSQLRTSSSVASQSFQSLADDGPFIGSSRCPFSSPFHASVCVVSQSTRMLAPEESHLLLTSRNLFTFNTMPQAKVASALSPVHFLRSEGTPAGLIEVHNLPATTAPPLTISLWYASTSFDPLKSPIRR